MGRESFVRCVREWNGPWGWFWWELKGMRRAGEEASIQLQNTQVIRKEIWMVKAALVRSQTGMRKLLLETRGKAIFVIKWQRIWQNCVHVLVLFYLPHFQLVCLPLPPPLKRPAHCCQNDLSKLNYKIFCFRGLHNIHCHSVRLFSMTLPWSCSLVFTLYPSMCSLLICYRE